METERKITRAAAKNTWLTSAMEYLQFFLLVSVLGWVWEVLVYWCIHGFRDSLFDLAFTFRGMLHGPWVPIYGAGACLMVFLRRRLPLKPGAFLLMNMAVCAVLEYATSFAMEVVFHARWWDYTGQFLNVNGRICAVSLVFFGLAGAAVAFVMEPCFRNGVQRIPKKARLPVSFLLAVLFLLDVSVSFVSPNLGIGVSLMG